MLLLTSSISGITTTQMANKNAHFERGLAQSIKNCNWQSTYSALSEFQKEQADSERMIAESECGKKGESCTTI